MPGEFFSKHQILFDLDGTLVDSSPAHARAFVEALRPHHPALAAQFDYTPHLGRPTRDVFRTLGVAGNHEITELTQRKQQLYRDAVAAGRVAVFPGVRPLLALLKAHGRQLYVVSGASRASTRRVLAGTGLDVFFSGVTTAEDARPGKPAPQPYLHALTLYRLAAGDCLAVEDAENGVLSARRAGIDAVLVNTDLQLPGVINIGGIENLASLLVK